jgi:hypothetical protein
MSMQTLAADGSGTEFRRGRRAIRSVSRSTSRRKKIDSCSSTSSRKKFRPGHRLVSRRRRISSSAVGPVRSPTLACNLSRIQTSCMQSLLTGELGSEFRTGRRAIRSEQRVDVASKKNRLVFVDVESKKIRAGRRLVSRRRRRRRLSSAAVGLVRTPVLACNCLR